MSQRKSGSQGRRSAKDLMSTHRTTGEPVLPAAESQQLVAMTPLLAPDFVVQNEFWLQGGIPDAEHSSEKSLFLTRLKPLTRCEPCSMAPVPICCWWIKWMVRTFLSLSST